jgi:hypothetical protein
MSGNPAAPRPHFTNPLLVGFNNEFMTRAPSTLANNEVLRIDPDIQLCFLQSNT